MKPTQCTFLLAIFCVIPISAEIITTGIAVTGSVIFAAGFAGYDVIKCSFYECCDNKWISPNFTGTGYDIWF